MKAGVTTFWLSFFLGATHPTSARPVEYEHPPELVALVENFRSWRAPASEGVPDYALRAKEHRQGLASYRQRLRAMNARSWPVHAQVDYLMLVVEMNALEFDLEVVRQTSRNPDFYTLQAFRRVMRHVGGRYQVGPGVSVPYDARRAAAILSAMNDTERFLQQASDALTEAVPEMADMAIERLENIEEHYAELARVLGPHLPEPYSSQVGPAAAGAGKALERYRQWLVSERPRMSAPLAIGIPALQWALHNVNLLSHSARDLLVQSDTERLRNWAFLQFERQKNRHLPGYEGPRFGGKSEPLPVPPVTSYEHYAELKDATDVLSRLWAEQHQPFTRPVELGQMRVQSGGVYILPFGLMGFPTEPIAPGAKTEFMVAPDHWFARAYQEFAKWMDPGINHPHSDYPGHTFESAVTRRTTCELRRGHRTRGDAWTFYMEELQLQLDYPFVRGPRVREWMYAIALWRVERLVTGVNLAAGWMTPKEAETYLVDTVPWMDPWKAKRMEVWNSLGQPTFSILYQTGKFELLKLLRDRMRQQGLNFDLGEFHDAFLATGQIPIGLARWELAGIDDDVKHLWKDQPIPHED